MKAVNGTLSSRILALGTAALLGVLVATPPAWAGGGAPSPGAPGLGDRLYPLLGNGGYDVQNYDLSLTYPRRDPAQQITGTVTITAVATQSLSRFDLDFGGDSVAKVSVDGRPATFTRDGDELVVTPRRAIAERHRFTVTVSGFTATPVAPNADSPAGFIKTPDGTALAGQPASSHLLFASNDHPRDMATYTITLTAPEGWTGTANGVRVRTREHAGYVSSVYRESRPMASELVQVAVGDFVVRARPPVNGVPIRDVAPRRLADQVLPKMADVRNQVAWMESQVGRYPFENYGSLVIDGNLGFALETQTLSLYDTLFAGLPQFVIDPIAAHELAHQWFGDSVAPARWSDVWQNEGHATWYELRYAQHIGVFARYTGHADEQTHFKAIYAAGDRYRARYGPVANPLRADSIWDVFNPNVYDGGALVLYALRQKVGAATFQKIERTWVAANRGRSVSTDDFIALASKVSHQDLRAFLRAWLYGTTTPPMPGHPDWTVTPPTAAAATAPAGSGAAGRNWMSHAR